jgi:hypothetical protein
VGDLTSVEGGFTTGLGKFQASWMLIDSHGHSGKDLVVSWKVPAQTQGMLMLSVSSRKVQVTLNAKSLSNGSFIQSVFEEELVQLSVKSGSGSASVNYS